MSARDEFRYHLPVESARWDQYNAMCNLIDALRGELVVAREDADRLANAAECFRDPSQSVANAIDKHRAVVASRTKEPQ